MPELEHLACFLLVFCYLICEKPFVAVVCMCKLDHLTLLELAIEVTVPLESRPILSPKETPSQLS